jgi:hypothetical protein
MKIAPVEFAHLCDYASVSMDGKLSLAGIFDRFMVKDAPTVHPMLFIVTKLILPEGEHNITFTLMQEDQVLAKSNADKKIEGKLGAHVHFWNIRNLKIEKLDEPVELQILIDGKQVYVKRIPVIQVKPKDE